MIYRLKREVLRLEETARSALGTAFCYLAWDDLVLLVTSAKFWLGIAETVIAFAIPVAIYEWAMRSRKKKK